MYRATKDKKELVTSILSDSFKTNKSITYVVKQDSKADLRRKKLMEYSFNVGIASGEIFISNDHKSCAILLYPEVKLPIWKKTIYNIDLAVNCIGLSRVPKVIKRENIVKSKHPKEKFMHLWYIGVDSNFQGQNIGSGLMREIISFAKKEKRKIYLETSNLKNISFYKKLGFKNYDIIKNIGFDLFMLHN